MRNFKSYAMPSMDRPKGHGYCCLDPMRPMCEPWDNRKQALIERGCCARCEAKCNRQQACINPQEKSDWEERKRKKMNLLERMKAAKSADDGRDVIADYEKQLHDLETEFGLEANVGQVDDKYFVGFPTIKSPDWKKYLKNAKTMLIELHYNQLSEFIAMGHAIDKEWDERVSLIAEEPEETAPVFIRATTKELPVKFTSREMEKFSEELVLKLQEKSRLEGQKSSSISMYAAKLKEVSGTIEVLTDRLSSKSENKSVACEWHMNFPKPNRKTLFRVDTQEILEEDEMLPGDRQMVLDDLNAKSGKTERNVDEKEITMVPNDVVEEDDENEEADEHDAV